MAALATAAYPFSLEAAAAGTPRTPAGGGGGEGPITPQALQTAASRLRSAQAVPHYVSPSGAYSPYSEAQVEPGTPGTPGSGRRKVAQRLAGQVGFFEEQYIKRQTEKKQAQSPRHTTPRSGKKKPAVDRPGPAREPAP